MSSGIIFSTDKMPPGRLAPKALAGLDEAAGRIQLEMTKIASELRQRMQMLLDRLGDSGPFAPWMLDGVKADLETTAPEAARGGAAMDAWLEKATFWAGPIGQATGEPFYGADFQKRLKVAAEGGVDGWPLVLGFLAVATVFYLATR